jgi:hypothetical protein
VIALLQEELGKAQQSGDEARIQWLVQFTNTLRELTESKLNSLTIGLLHQADEYEDEETKVTSMAFHTRNVGFGLWVHTSAKYGRIKSIRFPELGMDIDLPVALQKSRTSIRAVQTSYDFVSDAGRHKQPPASGDEDTKKKLAKKLAGQRYTSIGGVVSLQQMALPPDPKEAKGWTMREITTLTTSTHTIAYPTQVEGGSTGTQAPLHVSYKVPEMVYLSEGTPQYGNTTTT